MQYPTKAQTERLLGLVCEVLISTPKPSALKAYQTTCYVDRTIIGALRQLMVEELCFPEAEVRKRLAEAEVRKRLERIKKERASEQV